MRTVRASPEHVPVFARAASAVWPSPLPSFRDWRPKHPRQCDELVVILMCKRARRQRSGRGRAWSGSEVGANTATATMRRSILMMPMTIRICKIGTTSHACRAVMANAFECFRAQITHLYLYTHTHTNTLIHYTQYYACGTVKVSIAPSVLACRCVCSAVDQRAAR